MPSTATAPARSRPRPRPLLGLCLGTGLGFCLLAWPTGGAAAPAFSLIFRNDTADAERALREGYARAQDDHLTVSLGARLEKLPTLPRWELAADLHVITERHEGRRADLGLVRLSRAGELGPLDLKLGLGLAAIGRLGGEWVQNGYHQLSHNAVLHLDYPAATQWTPLLQADLSLLLWRPVAGEIRLEGTGLESAGFHSERLGLGMQWQAARLTAEGWAGAAWRHGLHEQLASSFEDGPVYGGLLAWSLRSATSPRPPAELCLFLLANAARQDQSLPGLALRVGPRLSRGRMLRVAWGP